MTMVSAVCCHKTPRRGRAETQKVRSTVDLLLTSAELADEMVTCNIHPTVGSFVIKEQEVSPRAGTRILWVIMDAKRCYKEYIARAAVKGLSAATCLRRLRMLALRAAR